MPTVEHHLDRGRLHLRISRKMAMQCTMVWCITMLALFAEVCITIGLLSVFPTKGPPMHTAFAD